MEGWSLWRLAFKLSKGLQLIKGEGTDLEKLYSEIVPTRFSNTTLHVYIILELTCDCTLDSTLVLFFALRPYSSTRVEIFQQKFNLTFLVEFFNMVNWKCNTNFNVEISVVIFQHKLYRKPT